MWAMVAVGGIWSNAVVAAVREDWRALVIFGGRAGLGRWGFFVRSSRDVAAWSFRAVPDLSVTIHALSAARGGVGLRLTWLSGNTEWPSPAGCTHAREITCVDPCWQVESRFLVRGNREHLRAERYTEEEDVAGIGLLTAFASCLYYSKNRVSCG